MAGTNYFGQAYDGQFFNITIDINVSDTSTVTDSVQITVVLDVHRQPDVYQDGPGVVVI